MRDSSSSTNNIARPASLSINSPSPQAKRKGPNSPTGRRGSGRSSPMTLTPPSPSSGRRTPTSPKTPTTARKAQGAPNHSANRKRVRTCGCCAGGTGHHHEAEPKPAVSPRPIRSPRPASPPLPPSPRASPPRAVSPPKTSAPKPSTIKPSNYPSLRYVSTLVYDPKLYPQMYSSRLHMSMNPAKTVFTDTIVMKSRCFTAELEERRYSSGETITFYTSSGDCPSRLSQVACR